MSGEVIIKSILIYAFVLSCFVPTAYAIELHVNPAVEDCSIELDPSLTQGQFREFTRQLGLIASVKLLGPAEPLGTKTFDIGIEYSASPIDDSDPSWNNTFTHPDATHELGNTINVPRVYARIGVSDAIDAGVNFLNNSEANYGFVGGEVKYAFFLSGQKKP